jgi:Fur family ferric uptake transcriptional regulator
MEDLLSEMRDHGYRITQARRAVVQTLDAADAWLSPELIQCRAQDSCPGLGLVTVYRTLSLLSSLGYVRRIHLEGGCNGYARAGLQHSHHLVCRSCQQVVEFLGSEDLTPLVERIEGQTGFRIEDHMLELLGLCPDCQTREAA